MKYGPYGINAGAAGGLPAGATSGPDNAIARWDGTTAIQGSGVILTDADEMQFPAAGWIRLGLAPGSGAGAAAGSGDLRTQGGARDIVVARNNADTLNNALLSTDVGDHAIIGGVRAGVSSGELYSATGILTLEPSPGVSGMRLTGTSLQTRTGGTLRWETTNTLTQFDQPITIPNAGDYLAIGSIFMPTIGAIRTQVDYAWYSAVGATNVHLMSYVTGNTLQIGETTTLAGVRYSTEATSEHIFYCGAAARKFGVSAAECLVQSTRLELATGVYMTWASNNFASQGNSRAPHAWAHVFRNNANTGDLSGLWMATGSDLLNVGGVNGTAARPSQIAINPSTTIVGQVGSTTQFEADTNGVELLRGLDLSDQVYTSVDSPVSIPQGNVVFGFDTTGGAITATLPSAAANAGQYICIVDEKTKFNTNNLTLYCAAGDTIQNVDRSSATGTAYIFSRDDECMWLHSDGGTNWRIVN